jgi:SAM-dependent methyltransferase
MQQQFWNSRYAENETVYGNAPNLFFKEFIDSHKPGSILLPAEGEGRNAVYAAKKGWKVDAFDFSEVAKEKALKAAEAEAVSVNYAVKTIESFRAEKQYDAVALIYVHVPPMLRQKFHNEIVKSLKPDGWLVLEAFAKEQAKLESGGPRDEALLYDAPSLCKDFHFLNIISCRQNEINLEEGPFHRGKAAVLRFIGQRI